MQKECDDYDIIYIYVCIYTYTTYTYTCIYIYLYPYIKPVNVKMENFYFLVHTEKISIFLFNAENFLTFYYVYICIHISICGWHTVA